MNAVTFNIGADVVTTLQPAITGLLVTLSLIVAIGAQNLWVLQKSLRHENPKTIALVGIGLDIVLMTIGVFGVNYVQQKIPDFVPVMTWLGILLLISLAIQAMVRALHAEDEHHLALDGVPQVSPWRSAGELMALSLLNPHVYLDTIVLIGSVGARQSNPWLFLAGASLASTIWFSLLVFGSMRLRPWLTSPARWRVLDLTTALILLLVAASLVPL